MYCYCFIPKELPDEWKTRLGQTAKKMNKVQMRRCADAHTRTDAQDTLGKAKRHGNAGKELLASTMMTSAYA